MPTLRQRKARVALIVATFAAAGAIASCKDFLHAENPAAIKPEVLEDTNFIPLIMNGAMGDFQTIYPLVDYYSAVFTDELRNTHVFSEEVAYDRRDVDSLNGTHGSLVYAPLQRARWLADSAGGRIRALEGDSANRDLRMARSLLYAGYGLVTLAEYECATPVSTPDRIYSPALNPEDVFAMAIARFDTAATIAAAAKAAATASTASTISAAAKQAIILGADSVRLAALVGAARAALNMGDKTKATQYASLVTPFPGGTDFQFRIYFNSNTSFSRIINPLRDRLSGGSGVTSGALSGTPFEGIDDIRVPYPRNATTGAAQPEATMNGQWVVPNSPTAFSTYNGTKDGVDFAYDGWLRLASLLEAQYILAEAGGATAANIAFVESRRTSFPSSTATTPTTAANFLDNLIDQRRRDFYLDGHRLGDIRRYKKLYGKDFYQHGTVPGQTLTFSNRECLPLNLAEYQNNPAVRNP